MSILSPILDIFLPRQCFGCGSFDTWICTTCCTKSLQYERLLLQNPLYPIHTIHTFGWYAEPVWKRSIAALKFNGIQEIGQLFGEICSPAVLSYSAENAVLVPIPLHPKRLRERGFNQAELIAHHISQRSGIPVNTQLLTRTNFHTPQTTVSMQEREHNVANAFALSATAFTYNYHKKTFFLIDDVVTTGATSMAAARILQHLSPDEIHLVTVARGH